MQNTELIFPPGTVAGDMQCLGIPIIDNNRADGTRNFFVSLVAFDPLVRILPIYSTKLVFIVDNDGELFTDFTVARHKRQTPQLFSMTPCSHFLKTMSQFLLTSQCCTASIIIYIIYFKALDYNTSFNPLLMYMKGREKISFSISCK